MIEYISKKKNLKKSKGMDLSNSNVLKFEIIIKLNNTLKLKFNGKISKR